MTATTTNPDRTLWGLDVFDLHARFWASRGVQVVRLGERSEIVPHAELFLLTDPRTLTLFRPAAILDTLCWMNADLVAVRLVEARRDGYRERVVSDQGGRFRRFERMYHGADPQKARLGLTSDRELAQVWQSSPDPREGWRRLRRLVPRPQRHSATVRAKVYDASFPEETARFLRELVQIWRRPDATIGRIRQVQSGVWADETAGVRVGPGVRGPLWIGAGRQLPTDASAVGPAVMWDRPDARPAERTIEWLELEPLSGTMNRPLSPNAHAKRPFKRMFDIVFALFALALTLPLYPFIALAIIIEDGFPVFFGHTRQTLGGRDFNCLKFRSMRRDAEAIKARLAGRNQADGPQFYIKDDPRLTRVGRFLRAFQLDELPQFINVLKGDMSVVGPRPSPNKENQFCPAWREARLSVRPGVTGLWQTSRTRVEGADFQEWIKYDIEYVERQSASLDAWIIWRTIAIVFREVIKP